MVQRGEQSGVVCETGTQRSTCDAGMCGTERGTGWGTEWGGMVQRGEQGGVVCETETQSTCDAGTYGTERGTEWGGMVQRGTEWGGMVQRGEQGGVVWYREGNRVGWCVRQEHRVPVMQVRMVQRGEQSGEQSGVVWYREREQSGVVCETGTQSTCDAGMYGTERGTERGTEWGGV